MHIAMHIAMHILQQLVNVPRSIHAVLSVEVWAKMNNKKKLTIAFYVSGP